MSRVRMLLFFILLVSPPKPLLPGRAYPHQLTAVVTNTSHPQMTWRFKDLMGAQVPSAPATKFYVFTCARRALLGGRNQRWCVC